jgi:hypothetical protein
MERSMNPGGEENILESKKIQRALISVSDKTGIIEFAKKLSASGIEILSTGGTARTLREAGVTVKSVDAHTGHPEIMDGRVKTLHPRIHGGILAVRDNPLHIKHMRENGISPIDLVVVNLYPFVQTVSKPGVTIEEAVENIDIGGPAMYAAPQKTMRMWRSWSIRRIMEGFLRRSNRAALYRWICVKNWRLRHIGIRRNTILQSGSICREYTAAEKKC